MPCGYIVVAALRSSFGGGVSGVFVEASDSLRFCTSWAGPGLLILWMMTRVRRICSSISGIGIIS